MCVYFQVKQTTLTFLAQTCPKMDLRLKIQKTNVGIRMIIPEILCAPIFRQNGQLSLFRSKFAQKCILGSKFQKFKWGFGISTSNQFSVKTGNFEFFHLNLGKLPNHMWYFGSNNVEGVTKNSMETEMSWVEVGPKFSNTLKFINYTSRATVWQKAVL